MITNAEKEFCFFKLGLSGSFIESLINTAFRADIHNQHKLALGFPELIEVVIRYQTESGYWENLVERWNQESPGHKLYR